MNKTKRGKFDKLGSGAITYKRELLGRLRWVEFEEMMSLVKVVGQTLSEEKAVKRRTTLVCYGNPAVVELDIKKMAAISYEQWREDLMKLEDVYEKAAREDH